MAIASIPLARVIERAHWQRVAVRAVTEAGGRVVYDWQHHADGSYNPAAKGPPGPKWLHRLLGPAYFETVAWVDLDKDADDDVLRTVGRLDDLTTLTIYGAHITDAGLAHIAGLERLRGLTLMCPEITDAGLVHLRRMARLKQLVILEGKIQGGGLDHLRNLQQLEVLTLPDGVANLTPLRHLTRLQRLRASGRRLDDAGIQGIGDLKELSFLDLRMAPITDAGLAELARLKSLGYLCLNQAAITDAGLAALADLPALYHLDLSGTQITGTGLDALAGAKSLRFLALNFTRVNDATAVSLRRLESLVRLELAYTNITDNSLEHLTELRKLRNLVVTGTAVTREGLAKLYGVLGLKLPPPPPPHRRRSGSSFIIVDVPDAECYPTFTSVLSPGMMTEHAGESPKGAAMSHLHAVILHETRGTWLGWMGSPLRYTALGTDTQETYALSIGRVLPGVGPHAHRHDFEEGFFVISGELTFTAGNRTLTVPRGGFVNIGGGTAHFFQNRSAEPAELLVLTAPAGFDRFQMEVGERLDGPNSAVSPPYPDLPARMAAAAMKYGIDLDPPAAAFEQPPALHATLPGEGRCVGVVGDVYRFLATGRETTGKYALWEAIVPPGGGPPPHVHSREHEGFFIMEGEIAFEVAGVSVIGRPGTAVALPPGVRHAFRNVSHRAARMLVYVAPAALEEMFFEVGQPLAPGSATAPAPTDAEIERLLAAAPRYGIEIGPPHPP